jgi:hypothetical protein
MTPDFRHWLKTQPLSKIPHGPQGDFVMDARDDQLLPNVQSWWELKSYLYDRRACREAMLAAAGVWRHYSRKVAA